MFFAHALWCWTALMSAAIFGNVSSIMLRVYQGTEDYHEMLTSIKEFIKFYFIPKPLASRLVESYQHSRSYTHGIDMNSVSVLLIYQSKYLKANVLFMWLIIASLVLSSFEIFQRGFIVNCYITCISESFRPTLILEAKCCLSRVIQLWKVTDQVPIEFHVLKNYSHFTRSAVLPLGLFYFIPLHSSELPLGLRLLS